MSNEKTPVAYLHQVVCGDGEPDQALSFEPDNFPLSGVLGYRSLSHEPLFRAEPSNELERLRAALWQCFTDAGGDTDGKTDAAGISTDDLISTTTDCVKDLRLGYDEMLDESSEADRLRARVAKLESARGEPVAWMNPYGGTLQVRITGLEYEKYTIPLYTAPPAQAVDVDAISDEAIEQGCEAMWAHSYRIADPGSMRAALRAIFNKGE